MTTLRRTQDLFMDAVYGPGLPDLAPLLTHVGNFSIYQNNALLILTDVMKGNFPATVRLVGEDFFRTLCRDFIALNPPKKPNLNAYGRDFPDFLSGLENLKDYPFVPDVARLEWDMHEAYLAALEPAMGLDQLASLGDETLQDLVLPLQPCLRLRQSRFPVDRIWQAQQPGNETQSNIALDGAQVYLAIYREGTQVVIAQLTRGAFALLASVGSGQPFLSAVNDAIMADEAFDPGQHLAALFQLDVFSARPV